MRERTWKSWLTANGSYKLVALFVTLILWVTIFGRRDFQMERKMEIELLLPNGVVVAEKEFPDHVVVKVSGSRLAIKRFAQAPGVVAVDLTRSRAGIVRSVISSKQLDVPFGVKVVSIQPDSLSLTLKSVDEKK